MNIIKPLDQVREVVATALNHAAKVRKSFQSFLIESICLRDGVRVKLRLLGKESPYSLDCFQRTGEEVSVFFSRGICAACGISFISNFRASELLAWAESRLIYGDAVGILHPLVSTVKGGGIR